jgi:1-acyl-sn-glycerol-3-phosphate acyltransferase
MFYRFWRSFFRFLFTIFCHWEVEGLENLPSAGPVVVVGNHTSYWDPVVVASALPRHVYFMAKKELFGLFYLSWILRLLGAFPVDRQQADRSAIRQALTLLNNDQMIGIFPEGTRNMSGSGLLPPAPGAVYLALRTGAQVCPVALCGAGNLFSRGWFHHFKVLVGQPINFSADDRRDLQRAAEKVMEKIQELLDYRQ